MAARAMARQRSRAVRKHRRGKASDVGKGYTVPTLHQGQRSPRHAGIICEIQSSRLARGSREVKKQLGASVLASVDAAEVVTDAFNDDCRILDPVGEGH